MDCIRVAAWVPIIAGIVMLKQVPGLLYDCSTLLQRQIRIIVPLAGCLSASVQDNPNAIFVLFFLLRYARLVISIFAYKFIYQADRVPEHPIYTPDDVHVIISTVDPTNNAFEICVKTILANKPRNLTITAGGEQHVAPAWLVVNSLREYWGEAQIDVVTVPGRQGNKRRQMRLVLDNLASRPIENADTIVVFVDDHAWWPNTDFLPHLLAPFEDPRVGLVGTKKQVFRNRGETIIESFVNFLASIYLERHNFEITAQNAIDGGAFVISARTCAIRANIAMEEEFRENFTNEMFFFGRFGPLAPDDDNYITRYVVSKQSRIKFQNHPKSVMLTTLGERPDDGNSAAKKFRSQLIRWARSQWRSNPRSLCQSTVWKQYWMWSVPVVFLGTCFNFALLWDTMMVCLWSRTNFAGYTAYFLVAAIILSKLVKLLPYFLREPRDLIFFPGYVLFAYVHSLVKFYALITCYDGAWSGRKAEIVAEPAAAPDGEDHNDDDDDSPDDESDNDDRPDNLGKYRSPHAQTLLSTVRSVNSLQSDGAILYSGRNQRACASSRVTRNTSQWVSQNPASKPSTTPPEPRRSPRQCPSSSPEPLRATLGRSPRALSSQVPRQTNGPQSSSRSTFHHYTPWGDVNTTRSHTVPANVREAPNRFRVPSYSSTTTTTTATNTDHDGRNTFCVPSLSSYNATPLASSRADTPAAPQVNARGTDTTKPLSPPQTPSPFKRDIFYEGKFRSYDPSLCKHADKLGPKHCITYEPPTPPVPPQAKLGIILKDIRGRSVSKNPAFTIDSTSNFDMTTRRQAREQEFYHRNFARGADCGRVHADGTHLTHGRYFTGERRCRSPEPRYPVLPGSRL